MDKFEIIIYTKDNGETPAEEFICSLPAKMKAKVIGELEILAEYGNELREPYTKYLGDGIFELRIKQGSDISRVLYFFYDGRRIVVTNGFVKKTNRTPVREILRAKKYRYDFLRKRGMSDEA